MSLRSDRQGEKEKEKERDVSHRSEWPEEGGTMVQGGIPGLAVGEMEDDSVTKDEEELGEARGSGSGQHDGGQTHCNKCPHLYDLQDLNLYPSQYDHGFSQTYANLLY